MVNIEQSGKILKVSYINKEGKVDLYELDIPKSECFEWKYCTKSENYDKQFKSWDNKTVKKVSCQYLNKYRVHEFLYKQPQEIKDIIFQFNQPKICFCDIEVEVLDEFPNVIDTKAKVLTISMVNENEQVIVLGLKELSSIDIDDLKDNLKKYFTNDTINFKYIKFESEFSLLYTFLKKYVLNFPLITGWNFVDFDWAYIINRAKKLNIDVNMCSISNKLYGKNQIPLHKVIIDYLDIYKRWDTIVSMKESFSLDSVSMEVLKLKKVKYKGTLDDLYLKDFKTYVFYNAVDSYLVRLIHKKLNTLTPFLKLSQIANTEMLKCYGSVHLVENLMIYELLKYNKIFVFDKNKKIIENDEKFKGAFVKDPIKGFHSNLAVFDYASLYPTTIRQWNISPDVYLGKNIETDLDESEYIKTCSGAMFKRNEDGVLKTILTDLYTQRDLSKVNKGDIEKEIDILNKKIKSL